MVSPTDHRPAAPAGPGERLARAPPDARAVADRAADQARAGQQRPGSDGEDGFGAGAGHGRASLVNGFPSKSKTGVLLPLSRWTNTGPAESPYAAQSHPT